MGVAKASAIPNDLADQIAEVQKQLESLGVESAELGFSSTGSVLGRPTPVVKSIRLGNIGLAFFLAAVAFVLVQEKPDAAIISAISGGIAQAIAGLNFWLYGRTAQQLDAFHVRLEQTQRFLLANSVCQNLESAPRDAARASLVSLIATQTATPIQPPQ